MDEPAVRDRLLGRVVADGYEILAAELPQPSAAGIVVAVDAPAGQPAPLAFVILPYDTRWRTPNGNAGPVGPQGR